MKNIFIITLWSFMAFVADINAQVTIGSVDEPEKFSLLQLEGEGKKGLRIPQLTTQERDELTDSEEFKDFMKEEARGLVIYNKSTNTFQYWNGEIWTEL